MLPDVDVDARMQESVAAADVIARLRERHQAE